MQSSHHDDQVEVTVQSISGETVACVTISCEASALDLIEQISLQAHIPPSMINLVFGEQQLEASCSLEESGLKVPSAIVVLISDQVPLAGLQLWLDATDESTLDFSENARIMEWRSRGPPERALRPETNVGAPAAPGEDKLVHFGYDASLRIEPEVGRLQTIVSVHCFHKSSEGRKPFYILSGTSQGPFHGDSENNRDVIVSGHGCWVSPEAYFGRIRLGGEPWRLAKDVQTWNGLHVASFECSHELRGGDTVNRIGRDREFHEFCGSLGELLIYDRSLSEMELETIEKYLNKKWGNQLADRPESQAESQESEMITAAKCKTLAEEHTENLDGRRPMRRAGIGLRDGHFGPRLGRWRPHPMGPYF